MAAPDGTRPPGFEFAVGQKVLCEEDRRIYPAKVLQADVRRNPGTEILQPHYFVHWTGWNKGHDEWVAATRVMEQNEMNERLRIERDKLALEMQKHATVATQKPPPKNQPRVNGKFGKKPKKSKNAPTASTSATASASGSATTPAVTTMSAGAQAANTRRGRPSKATLASRISDFGGPTAPAVRPVGRPRGSLRKGKEKEDRPDNAPEFLRNFPEALRVRLVRDFELITDKDFVIECPRHPNVQEILERYQQSIALNDPEPSELQSVCQFIDGLNHFFNRSIAVCLLYKLERMKHAEQVAFEKVTPSTWYGAEHLLRLCVKLPELMETSRVEPETQLALKENLTGLIAWLDQEEEWLFASLEYVSVTPAYRRMNYP